MISSCSKGFLNLLLENKSFSNKQKLWYLSAQFLAQLLWYPSHITRSGAITTLDNTPIKHKLSNIPQSILEWLNWSYQNDTNLLINELCNSFWPKKVWFGVIHTIRNYPWKSQHHTSIFCKKWKTKWSRFWNN